MKAFFSVITESGKFAEHSVAFSDREKIGLSSFKQSFLSALILNLKTRFPDLGILSAFKILDPQNVFNCTCTCDVSLYGQEEIVVLSKHFSNHPSEELRIEESDLQAEYSIYEQLVIKNCKGKKFSEMYSHFLIQYGDIYPQMRIMIIVAIAIPVTSVPCERSFSAANRIKNKLRNRLLIRNSALVWFPIIKLNSCSIYLKTSYLFLSKKLVINFTYNSWTR